MANKSGKADGVQAATPPAPSAIQSGVGFRLAETRDAVAVFPLAPLFEDFRAFKTLEDITLTTQGGRRAETTML